MISHNSSLGGLKAGNGGADKPECLENFRWLFKTVASIFEKVGKILEYAVCCFRISIRKLKQISRALLLSSLQPSSRRCDDRFPVKD
jgi:hypothetical protein